jgi:hypothetical protein
LRQLIIAATELQRLKEMPPAAWKSEIKTLATRQVTTDK